MLINEAGKLTGLTKKAIEYYMEQGLIVPTVSENGYRDFSSELIERLKKIAVLRKLGLSVEEIDGVLLDTTGNVLHKIAVKQMLAAQKQAAKQDILDKLSTGTPYDEVAKQLQSLEQGSSIAERLLDAYPCYYGRFVCLHFARFLNEPITTPEQQAAYETIVSFLDDLPPFNLPQDLQAYVEEYTGVFSPKIIGDVMETTKHSIENPQEFLSQNKEFLEGYLAFKQSEEYKALPAARLQQYIKEFQQNHGYNTVFIPAMKVLSPSYATYSQQMEQANEALLKEYPEIAKL